MSGHLGARINIVRILWYQVYVLEDKAVEVVDLGSFCVANVEQLGTIELAHRALFDHEYPIIEILRLQKWMYVIHEDSKLTLSITVWQYDGHIEQRMAIEGFPLATGQDAEPPRHCHWLLSGMLFRVKQLGGSPTSDRNGARVIPWRV